MTPIYVVSGGARGITAQCTIEFARMTGGTYLLLGRSEHVTDEPAWAHGVDDLAGLQKAALTAMRAAGEKPHPKALRKQAQSILRAREISATLDQLAAVGAQGVYISVDITDAADVSDKLRTALQQRGVATGLIHGAGVLADKTIDKKTEADFDRVYDTKLIGLENLLAALPQLEHVVLFSSAAAYYGNAGQADYALANEILNKTAYFLAQQHPQMRVQSFDWGPWDGGMVTPTLKQYFEANNIDLIPLMEGAQAFAAEAQDKNAPSQVLVGSGFPPVRAPVDDVLRTHAIERVITPNDNPFLDHHQVKGQRVLPMVHALQWMIQAAEAQYPGYHFIQCDDLRVLKGIIAQDETAYTLELTEIEKNESRIVFDATIRASEVTIPHNYRARLTLSADTPSAPSIQATSGMHQEYQQVYYDGTLFHGPFFQTIRARRHSDDTTLTLECKPTHVPRNAQGQFRVESWNPFVADTVWQAVLILIHEQHGVLSLPMGIGRWQQFAPFPTHDAFFVTVQRQKTDPNQTQCAAWIHDGRGTVYAAVDGGLHIHMPNLSFEPYGA